ncbi:MAG: hypothetical protein JO287_25085 [Pseudonocardiales bacterium]|nr:hypothetical protein [Pseudonocardiales bacterium]
MLRQREWETTAGHKGYAYEVHATEVAVSLNYATAQVTKIEHEQMSFKLAYQREVAEDLSSCPQSVCVSAPCAAPTASR